VNNKTISEVDIAIENLVKKKVIELFGNVQPSAPELITVKEAAAIYGCNPSVIYSLVHDAKTNNFPAVKFGEQSIRIDRRRLYYWIESGCLLQTSASQES
jgi:predicted DNA-binding transcriptional regulator AlpA